MFIVHTNVNHQLNQTQIIVNIVAVIELTRIDDFADLNYRLTLRREY